MAHKYFEDQLDDEEMLLLFRKHPVVMRKGLIIAALGLLIGPLYVTLISFIRPDSTPTMGRFIVILLAGLLVSLLLFFPSWMSWFFSVYLLTDKRLIQIKQKGFFDRSLVDIGNNQISMVNYQVKGLQETLLGFGTINIQTYVGELVIKDVAHPMKIHKELTALLRENGYLQSGQVYGTEQSSADTEESEEG